MDPPKDQNLTGLSQLIQQVVQVCKIKFNRKWHKKISLWKTYNIQNQKKENLFEALKIVFPIIFWEAQKSLIDMKISSYRYFPIFVQISLQVQNSQSSLSVMRLRMKFSQLALISKQDAGKQIPCYGTKIKPLSFKHKIGEHLSN